MEKYVVAYNDFENVVIFKISKTKTIKAGYQLYFKNLCRHNPEEYYAVKTYVLENKKRLTTYDIEKKLEDNPNLLNKLRHWNFNNKTKNGFVDPETVIGNYHLSYDIHTPSKLRNAICSIVENNIDSSQLHDMKFRLKDSCFYATKRQIESILNSVKFIKGEEMSM